MKAPFPYFGGRSLIAEMVWDRLGDVRHYIEPFAGTLAVLLGRPHPGPHYETVNDKDALIANVWRAMRYEPVLVARHADRYVHEADLSAWSRHLQGRKAELRERLERDPLEFDQLLAGMWLWCQSSVMGDNLTQPHKANKPSVSRRGVQRMSLIAEPRGLRRYFAALSRRLRATTVLCGDWSRCVCSTTQLFKHGTPVGVFLDPPYAHEAGRDVGLYGEEDATVSAAVREWCIANGDDPRLRIALCGYDDEHEMPADWSCVPWTPQAGMSNLGNGRSKENRLRERVWFSPHCLSFGLFEEATLSPC